MVFKFKINYFFYSFAFSLHTPLLFANYKYISGCLFFPSGSVACQVVQTHAGDYQELGCIDG